MRRSETGAAAVELALVAPVLFAVLLGTVDLAWFTYESNEAAGAARDGARRAQVLPRATLDVAGGASNTAVRTAATKRLLYAPGVTVAVRCVTPAGVTTPCAGARTDIDRVRVTVAWTSPSLAYVLGASPGHAVSSTTVSTLVGSPS